ncbi:hypothetical protein R3P38DRAFT_2782164 [Favolaschia claudopus]|uniref:Uncharacterized protein n=1 Tax=Favolaschia claudopus TaxID=2862362 RepID=A0AAW0B1M8_9AGAR
MFFFLASILLSFALPAVCRQFTDVGTRLGNASVFHPDPLTAVLLGFIGLFTLLYIATLVRTNYALRGHPCPRAFRFLTSAISMFLFSNIIYIVTLILNNTPPVDGASGYWSGLPFMLTPTLSFVINLFEKGGIVLQFLTIVSVIWHRETALLNTSEGKYGGHPGTLIIIHTALVVMTCVFGIASEAYSLDFYVKVSQGSRLKGQEYLHRALVRQQLGYVFNAFAILMTVDVAVTTILLRRGWTKARVSDKITNSFLSALVPIYSVYGLLLMIFTITFSPSGLGAVITFTAYEGLLLAHTILISGSRVAILSFIVYLCNHKSFWMSSGDAQAGSSSAAEPSTNTVPPPAPQYEASQHYIYASPPEVPQAGYYPSIIRNKPLPPLAHSRSAAQPSGSLASQRTHHGQSSFPHAQPYSTSGPGRRSTHQEYLGHGTQQYEPSVSGSSYTMVSANAQRPAPPDYYESPG